MKAGKHPTYYEDAAKMYKAKGDVPLMLVGGGRALAEAALKGAPFEKKLVTRTYEGIDVQPVYAHRDRPDG